MSPLFTIAILLSHSLQVFAGTTTPFPFKQGWLGTDAAFSLQLPTSEKRLWFFGDTFVGNRDTSGFQKRSFGSGRFIFNSIGVSNGFDLNSVKYYWKTSSGAHGFFRNEATGPNTKFWPKSAFFHNGTLYVTLLLVEFKHSDAIFTPIATYLAQISNPYDSPLLWKINYIRLHDSQRIFPGSAVVNWGPYILMFSTLASEKEKHHQLILTRVKLPAPRHSVPSVSAEYLTKADYWKPFGRNMEEQAKILFKPASTDMSLLFHEDSGTWITVYSVNAFKDKTVKIRTAASPLGPWSEAKTLFEFSEFSQNIPGIFCYAAKGYKFRKTILTLSYTCNTMDIDQLLENKNIYIPKLMELNLSPYLPLKQKE